MTQEQYEAMQELETEIISNYIVAYKALETIRNIAFHKGLREVSNEAKIAQMALENTMSMTGYKDRVLSQIK